MIKNIMFEKTLENKDIKEILCPHCQKNYLILRRRSTYEDTEWYCKDCIFVYSENWFDVFKQYEEFVTRK